MIKKLVLFLCISVFCVSIASSQEAQSRWGQIDPELISFTEFSEDPDAKAIILFDKGEVYFNRSFQVVFKRHRRIKILDPDNSDFTEIVIFHNPRDNIERLRGLKAQTLNLDANGKVANERLRRRDFHEEQFSNNQRLTRFTFSDLKPGSVVEYEYTITSDYPTFLKNWFFQTSEPTIYSEFIAYIPDYFRYVRQLRGFETFSFHESVPYREGVQPTTDHNNSVSGFKHHWVMQNVPAVRNEPYITTVNDYRSQIDFQLQEVYYPSGGSKKVLGTWTTMIEELLSHESFGRQMNANRAIRNQVEELTAGLDSDLDKAKAIYTYITNNLSWNQRRGLITDNGIRRAFDQKSGDGPELTLLLVTMLREAGLNADPVILSTRNNGSVFWQYPLVSQFNHVIARTTIGSKSYLLEPLVNDLPFGSVLPQSLNGKGLIVNPNHTIPIDITANEIQVNRSITELTLESDGSFTGEIQLSYGGYAGFMNRARLRSADKEQFILDNILSDIPDSEILSSEFENMDNRDVALITKIQLQNSSYAMAAGDMIYMNPFLIHRLNENPFKLPTRRFPVDFNFGIDQFYVITINIPEGYTIVEMPPSRAVSLDNDASYRLVTEHSGSTIQLSSRFQIRKLVFMPNQYSMLREFHDEVVTMQASQLVFQKIPENGSGSE